MVQAGTRVRSATGIIQHAAIVKNTSGGIADQFAHVGSLMVKGRAGVALANGVRVTAHGGRTVGGRALDGSHAWLGMPVGRAVILVSAQWVVQTAVGNHTHILGTYQGLKFRFVVMRVGKTRDGGTQGVSNTTVVLVANSTAAHNRLPRRLVRREGRALEACAAVPADGIRRTAISLFALRCRTHYRRNLIYRMVPSGTGGSCNRCLTTGSQRVAAFFLGTQD